MVSSILECQLKTKNLPRKTIHLNQKSLSETVINNSHFSHKAVYNETLEVMFDRDGYDYVGDHSGKHPLGLYQNDFYNLLA